MIIQTHHTSLHSSHSSRGGEAKGESPDGGGADVSGDRAAFPAKSYVADLAAQIDTLISLER